MIEHAVGSSALIERRENMKCRYFVCDKGNVSGTSGLESDPHRLPPTCL